jgi:hypothetical protein
MPANLPEPKIQFQEIIDSGLVNKDSIFVGCISFEDRCLSSFKSIAPLLNKRNSFFIFDIEDDLSSDLFWKEKCQQKTRDNWEKMRQIQSRADVSGQTSENEFKISSRKEDFLKIIDRIKKLRKNDSKQGGIRCFFDMTCIPSYFGMQILKSLLENNVIKDLFVLYTKPEGYDKGILKTSPRDAVTPEFLPFFKRNGLDNDKKRWLICLGFDHDSIRNAERIRSESIGIEKIIGIIPFPGYKPEYSKRTILENKGLFFDKFDFRYVAADNPFRAYSLLKDLVSGNKNFIFSTFGPKPISIGLCLAAMKEQIPILHVQAISYNPDFSFGEGEKLVFNLKYNCNIWNF